MTSNDRYMAWDGVSFAWSNRLGEEHALCDFRLIASALGQICAPGIFQRRWPTRAARA